MINNEIIKKRDVVFLSCLIPKQIEGIVRSRSHANMQDAANALQWHIYEGLCANCASPSRVINVLPIGSFPQYYTKAFIKRQEFVDGKKMIINTGFCNIKLLRRFLLHRSLYRELRRYYAEIASEDKVLLVYTLNSNYLRAIRKIKKRIGNLKVCAIVADLPEMSSLSTKKSCFEKIFNKYFSSKSYSYSDCIDGYVLLTKQMADYMKIDKPFCVMEGISTRSNAVLKSSKPDSNIKTVLYTGTLHKRFGVMTLVEAFRKIESNDYRLVLCGVGDCEQDIKVAAQKDNRIVFKGQVTREEALYLQSEATVLVNPRQNNEEFTKYSFPSKNLEYLSSGVPLVAYKLDGIPDEYDDYVNYVESDSVEALMQAIVSVCDNREASLIKAAKASEFVQSEKNAQKQTLRILNLVDNL